MANPTIYTGHHICMKIEKVLIRHCSRQLQSRYITPLDRGLFCSDIDSSVLQHVRTATCSTPFRSESMCLLLQTHIHRLQLATVYRAPTRYPIQPRPQNAHIRNHQNGQLHNCEKPASTERNPSSGIEQRTSSSPIPKSPSNRTRKFVDCHRRSVCQGGGW